jgi:hypothetical protein
MRHGFFLIMGGIHLVEPVEGNSTVGTAPKTANDQQRNNPSVNADMEKGPAPCGKKVTKGRVTILTMEMLEALGPDIEIEVTEGEIEHTAKGDALSKTIFILQSSWFIVQCIARLVQGLTLTQLELTTLALASLNGVTLILWWEKPLGAQTVVRVYLKRKLTFAERAVVGVSATVTSHVLSFKFLTMNCSEVGLTGQGCSPTC